MKHFDFVPEGQKRPLLQGYRKMIVAIFWLALAVFAVLVCLLGKPSSGQITLSLWVVGSAGFFCSIFVVGNAAEWVAFWKVQTTATLSQADSKQEIVYQDTQEDSSWQKAEKEMGIK